MIRSITADDIAGTAQLAVAAELFPPEEVGIVERLMEDFFAAKRAEGHLCVVDEHDGELLGVAYYQPLVATDRTWELLMIGVRQDRHRQGRGAGLLRHVEDDLRARDQRLLLVQTSALPALDKARAFYLALGYGEEARVRDYYEPGDDMVLFRKVLQDEPAPADAGVDRPTGASGLRHR